MELTPQDIIEFMQMWYEEFKEVLPYERAESEAKRLIDFALVLHEERLERDSVASAGASELRKAE